MARAATPIVQRETQSDASGDSAQLATPLWPRLERAPLDTPLVVTGGFGEYRGGHFHAGLDFSTGGRVGKPVYAPSMGWIERVRSSGVGYGRSLYVHGRDGRLFVYGHLDAFDGPIAAYVQQQQDSSGQYEQDLWPEPRRFMVTAGQRLGFTGQSGAGGPHFHFEIRNVDMAMNPLRAGLRIPDASAPALPSLELEPLDDRSFVAGAQVPFRVALGASPETVSVEGSVRLIVDARDGVWSGVDRMEPWIVRMEVDGRFTECRFDSVSWATDMPEAEYVYDIGHVAGDKGIMLWAPAGFRPRVIATNVPLAEESGTVTVPAGGARTVRLSARDVDGNLTSRTLVLRDDGRAHVPRRAAGGKKSSSSTAAKHPRTIAFPGALRFSSLPTGFLRMSLVGTRASQCSTVVLRHAYAFTGAGARRAALIPPGEAPYAGRLELRGADAKGRWVATTSVALRSTASGGHGAFADFHFELPNDALFEPPRSRSTRRGAPALRPSSRWSASCTRSIPRA